MSDQRVLCLRCAKPLQATIYKTCDDCRDTAAEKRRIALAQKSLLPTTSTPVVLCSRCHQPWQSAIYKTCENCRAKDAERRSAGLQKQRQLTTVHPLLKKRRFTNTTISAIERSAAALLESDFEERKAASADFPPDISTAVIRSSIRRYEEMMDTASLLICGSCGELIPSTDICTLESDDSRLHVIGQDHLDSCARHGTSWDFCRQCCAAPDRQFLSILR
jgi:uncharacterized CHY-type Zn-finger protein